MSRSGHARGVTGVCVDFRIDSPAKNAKERAS